MRPANKDEALVGEQIYLFHTLATCYLIVLIICAYGEDVKSSLTNTNVFMTEEKKHGSK